MKVIKDNTDKIGFPYIAYIPDELNKKPSVIFQLHGAGERGDGTNLDAVLVHGFTNIITEELLSGKILIMPQCPADSFWVAKIETLKTFIDKCIALYGIDKKKVFLCGLSMGGYGTWYTAMAYPDMFRAIAPCCGGGMPWNAGVLKMPIWAFHGKEDPVVAPHETYDMVEALEKCSADVRHTYYDNVGHDSWDKAFSPELIKWFESLV